MNYGARLLGATISIMCYLRLCGVLGEVTDLRTSEIYADFFNTHSVNDVVKGWLLRDNSLVIRNTVASVWDSANNFSEENHTSSMCTFFGSPATREVIVDDSDDNLCENCSYSNWRYRLPACYLDESHNRNISGGASSTESPGTIDQGIGLDSGCRLEHNNDTLICESSKVLTLPHFPPKLQLFELNSTAVTYLHERAFGTTEIVTIKIHANKLNCIHPYAFEGVNVRMLYIENNLIDYFRPENFPTLVNVSIIFIEHNKINLLQTPFGIYSSGSECPTVLPSLTHLSLLGNPLTRIPSDYFCPLRNSPLNGLDLTNCHLKTIESGALSYLTTLKTLRLGENPSLMSDLDEVLAQLENPVLNKLNLESNSLSQIPKALQHVWRTLETLDLSGNIFDEIAVDSFPSSPTNLNELNLENCRIRSIETDAFKSMEKLETLILSKNRLASIPNALTWLPRLTLLELSSQYPPKSSVASIGSSAFFFKINPQAFKNSSSLKTLQLSHLSQFEVSIDRDSFKHLINLEYLYMADTNLESIPDYTFEKLNKLRMLDLTYNKLTTIQDISFYGLEDLFGLYLDSNNLDLPCPTSVSPEDRLNLTHVEAYPDSIMGKNAMRDNDGLPLKSPTSAIEPFRYMPNLNILKLTNNRIRFVNSLLFQRLPNLKEVDLGGNLFKSWSERVFINGSQVAIVSLARNNIGYVSPAMLEDFHDVISRGNSALDMSENPLVCFDSTCTLIELANNGTLPLTNWENNNKYMCWDIWTNDYYSLMDMTDRLESGCKPLMEEDRSSTSTSTTMITNTPTSAIIMSSSSTTIPTTTTPTVKQQTPPTTSNDNSSSMVTLGIIVLSVFFTTCLGVVGYKKRFHLKYFWFVVKFNVVHSPNLNLKNLKKEDSVTPIYDYDLFVSYNQSDRDFIENKLVPEVEGDDTSSGDVESGSYQSLRICIHERDFKAGVPITDNIVDCVDRSRKVVVVVSKNYLESQWCLYEMNLAYHRLIESRRKAFVVILLEDIPSSLRTKSLNYLLLSRTYLEWPGMQSTVSEQCTFWKRLRSSLSDLD